MVHTHPDSHLYEVLFEDTKDSDYMKATLMSIYGIDPAVKEACALSLATPHVLLFTVPDNALLLPTPEIPIRNFFELVGAMVSAYGPVSSANGSKVATDVFKEGAEATSRGIFYYHEHRGSVFAQETLRPLRKLPESQAAEIWKEEPWRLLLELSTQATATLTHVTPFFNFPPVLPLDEPHSVLKQFIGETHGRLREEEAQGIKYACLLYNTYSVYIHPRLAILAYQIAYQPTRYGLTDSSAFGRQVHLIYDALCKQDRRLMTAAVSDTSKS